MHSIIDNLFGSGLSIIGEKEEHYVVHCKATLALCLYGSASNCSETRIANDRYLLIEAQVTAVTLPNNRGKFKLVRGSTKDNQIIHIDDTNNVSPKLDLYLVEEVYVDADSPEGSDILSKVPNLPGFLNQSDDFTVIPVNIRQDSPTQFTAVVDYFNTDMSDWPCPLIQSDTDCCFGDDECEVGYESILTPETIIETSCENFSSDLFLSTVEPFAMEEVECSWIEDEEFSMKIDESAPPKPTKVRKHTGRKRRGAKKSRKQKLHQRGKEETPLDAQFHSEDIWVASLCQSEEVTPSSSRNSTCSESYESMTKDALPHVHVDRNHHAEMADAYQAKFKNEDGGCSLMILANVAAMSLQRMMEAEVVTNYVEGDAEVSATSEAGQDVEVASATIKDTGSQQNVFPKRMKLTDHDPYRRRTRSSKAREENTKKARTTSFEIDCNNNNNEW